MERLKTYWRKILLGLAIVLFFLAQVFMQKEEEPLLLPTSTKEEVSEPKYIYVDLKGQVYYPGVYKVLEETRLFQVVEQAGGFTSGADRLAINLSMKLYDQSVVYIPHLEEGYPSIHDQDKDGQPVKININQATLEDLMELPGVGEVTASAILSYRMEMGGFSKIEELVNVPGIGEATFERLKDLISIS